MKWMNCLITLDCSERHIDRSVINLIEHFKKMIKISNINKLRIYAYMLFRSTEIK